MKKMFKGLLALMAILALGLVLVACGDEAPEVAGQTPEAPPVVTPPTPQAPPVDETPDPVEISVWWWGGDFRHAQTIEVIELFQDRYPHITVNYDFAGFADYWTMLTTAAAGNQLPTVLQMDLTRLSEYTENNLIIGLNDFINSGQIDMSNVNMPVYQGQLNLGGEYMAISLGANGFAMVYNTDLADELGLEFSPELTWDEFGDMLRVARDERDDFYGFVFGAHYEVLNIYMRDAGYSMYGDGEFTGSRDVLIDFFTMIEEWTNDGIMLTLEREDALSEGQSTLYSEIVIAQTFASNQIVHQQNHYMGEDGPTLGLALLPRIDGGRGGNWMRSSMQFSIGSQATPEEQAAGAKFINFFINDLEANEIMMAERGAPISSAVRAHLAPLVSPVVARTFDILPTIAAHAAPADRISPPQQAAVRGYVDRATEAVRFGDWTPEEAADYIITGAEDAFSW